VQILAKREIRSGRVEVDGLDIVSADARAEREGPQDYGVYVLQGAFTLWNMQPDDVVVINADLANLSVGRFGSPVLGSGVLIGGAGERGGRLDVQRLETGAVYSDGKIPAGTADEIAGGVFTVYGANVDSVTNHGPVVTYGVNDMALDNWGVVERWVAKEKVTTSGASGIGFVNFGLIRDLRIEAPIETFGQGARGFNVYAGRSKRLNSTELSPTLMALWACRSASRSERLWCGAASRHLEEPGHRSSKGSCRTFQPSRSASSPADRPK
jgi:hypothetical protein